MRIASVAWVLLAAMGTTALHAEELVTGRWARDPSACTGFGLTQAQSPLVVTETAVRWSDESCRIARMYKTGDTVHIQAICWGANGERSVPVSLRAHGGRLQVRWDRVVSGELRRCR